MVGIVFGVVAIGHAIRLFMMWELVVDGFIVPPWVSVIAVLITGYLAGLAFKFKR